MSFPCTQCGQCCQHIHHVPQLASYHNGDGICVHYEPQQGCKIYANRPDVCRIDDGYALFVPPSVSIDDYYRETARICNQLQEANHVDLQFRVIL